MNLMRKDCFASRLGEAQRAELLAALEGGMTLGEAAAWAHERSVPKRKTPPSEASVCKWFGQERRARAMREWMNAERGSRNGEVSNSEGGGRSADGPNSNPGTRSAEGANSVRGARSAAAEMAQRVADEEMEAQVRRGLLKAKHYCVMEGLEAREVAAFERNEIARQRLDLEERKHEYAMQVSDSAKKLEAMQEQLDAMQESLDEMTEEAGADRAKRKKAFDAQVVINMMLINLQRTMTGEQFWLPEKEADGRYHRAVPDQADVPIETVERAVAMTRAADLLEIRRVATELEAAEAAEKAEGLKGGKAEAAAHAAETPNAKNQTPEKIQSKNEKPEEPPANDANGREAGDAAAAAAEHRTSNGSNEERGTGNAELTNPEVPPANDANRRGSAEDEDGAGTSSSFAPGGATEDAAPGAAGSSLLSDEDIVQIYEENRAEAKAKSAAAQAKSDAQIAESKRAWRVAKGLEVSSAEGGTRSSEVRKPEVSKPEAPKADRWGGQKPSGQYW